MRERRRLLIDPARLKGVDPAVLALDSSEVHYLGRVLRLRPGGSVEVGDGAGALWGARLESGDRLRLEQPRHEPLRREPPPHPRLRLALAVPRRDVEIAWRMATELGADRLRPLIAQRGVVAGRLPLERWRSVVREAAEQCERLWLPELEPVEEAATWLGRPPAGTAWLATTRREGLPLLAAALQALETGSGGTPGALTAAAAPPASGSADELTVAIGPEGGWTSQEEEEALAAGWQPVSLGEPILRTATAAVAAVTLLATRRALSRPSFPWPSP